MVRALYSCQLSFLSRAGFDTAFVLTVDANSSVPEVVCENRSRFWLQWLECGATRFDRVMADVSLGAYVGPDLSLSVATPIRNPQC